MGSDQSWIPGWWTQERVLQESILARIAELLSCTCKLGHLLVTQSYSLDFWGESSIFDGLCPPFLWVSRIVIG